MSPKPPLSDLARDLNFIFNVITDVEYPQEEQAAASLAINTLGKMISHLNETMGATNEISN